MCLQHYGKIETRKCHSHGTRNSRAPSRAAPTARHTQSQRPQALKRPRRYLSQGRELACREPAKSNPPTFVNYLDSLPPCLQMSAPPAAEASTPPSTIPRKRPPPDVDPGNIIEGGRATKRQRGADSYAEGDEDAAFKSENLKENALRLLNSVKGYKDPE
jgi:hypothetical protein